MRIILLVGGFVAIGIFLEEHEIIKSPAFFAGYGYLYACFSIFVMKLKAT